MNKWLVSLVTALLLMGCATTGPPTQIQIIGEAGAIALLAFETSDAETAKEKGADAVEAANSYLLAMYGPKYSIQSLIHSEVLEKIVDDRVRRLMFIARLVLNKDGTFTGVEWLDAILIYDADAGEVTVID